MASVMAKLVAVVRNDDYKYGKRQMPLNVEDKLTMVLQFPDVCLQCGVGTTNRTRADLDRFTQRFKSMDTNQRMASTSTNQEEIANQIAALIPCVGCRKSVERLLDHLTLTGNSALDPLIFTKKGKLEQVTLRKVFREEPHVLFAMFYTHGDRLQDFLDSIPRSKKNKRCHLHSLDTQKTKSTTNWVDLWALLSDECKEEVLMIDYQKFMEAMIVYLDKHRFCIDCKTKVLHAHGLLIGDDCKKKDKGFNAALYDGIDYCKNAKHVHVKNDTEFIAHLIARAEPDLMGRLFLTRRERHAKTMEIAQEEVLTCLGSYLYVRFNRLLQKIRLEEQTWRQLFYIITCCLRQNYEMEYEKKQGVSQLELLCTEIENEQRNKEHKKEIKRKKKKKSKQDKKLLTSAAKQTFSHNLCQSGIGGCIGGDGDSECSQCVLESQLQSDATVNSSTSTTASVCTCELSSTTTNGCTVSTVDICSCDTADTESVASYNQSPVHVTQVSIEEGGGEGARQLPYCTVKASSSDLGYSSGPEGCDSCSHASSNSTDGAGSMLDVAYCDRHNPGTSSLDHSCEGLMCEFGLSNPTTTGQRSTQQMPFRCTLQDMLETCSDEEEEESGQLISEADIAAFRANMPSMNEERLQLRQKLRQRFDRMQKQRHRCTSPRSKSNK